MHVIAEKIFHVNLCAVGAADNLLLSEIRSYGFDACRWTSSWLNDQWLEVKAEFRFLIEELYYFSPLP